MIDLTACFDTYLKNEVSFILACSSGPDSIFLLYKILETRYKENLIVVYVNHGLRKEASLEERFLERLAAKECFHLEIYRVDIPHVKTHSKSKSTEELAREKRYEILENVRKKHSASHILTAHHLDDKIETFFFNLIRGTKLTGLINMTIFSGNIFRPLLTITKQEILTYLHDNHIPYLMDASNTDMTISRNKLRGEILPKFASINHQYKKNIEQTITYLGETKTFIDEQVKIFLGEGKSFSLEDFYQLSLFLQKEIIRYLYFHAHNSSTIGLSEANIKEILRFFSDKGNHTQKTIKKLQLKKKNGIIYIIFL